MPLGLVTTAVLGQALVDNGVLHNRELWQLQLIMPGGLARDDDA